MKTFASFVLSLCSALLPLVPMPDLPLLPLTLAAGFAALALRIIIKTPPAAVGTKVVVAIIVVLQGWVYFDITTRGTRLLFERFAV